MLPPLAIQMREPPRPEVAATSAGDVYVRVTALERQVTLDHEYLTQMVRAVRGLEANFDKAHRRLEAAEEELRNPRRDFAIRQEFRDLKVQLESDVLRGHEQIHNTVGPQMAELRTTLNEVQVAMVNFRDKEAQIEAYLVTLDNDRPREGQRLITGFEHVQNEIVSVREMVQRLESQPRVHTAVPNASHLAEEVRVGILGIQKATEENTRGLHELSVNVANVGINGAHTAGRVDLLEGGVKQLHSTQCAKMGLTNAFSGHRGCQSGDGCGHHGGHASSANPFALPPLRSTPNGSPQDPGAPGG